MTDHIAAVDAGNGGTNALLAKAGGGFKAHYEPSIRAAATGDTIVGLDKFVVEADYIDWNGYRYVSGDDALRFNRNTLERHMGSNRYGNEFQQFLVAVSLAKLGVKEGTVDLTLFAPPGLFNEARQNIIQRFTDTKGEITIRLKGDKKPRVWHYERVTVWPEGIGAAACFILDDKGEAFRSDVLNGEVLVLDSGAHTMDALKLTNGSFNVETLQHATWENGGVHVHLREPVLRTLKKQSEDFELLTVDDIDRVIRLGTVSGDYTLTSGAYSANIEPLIRKYSERYAEWVANNIIDQAFNALRGIKSLILVGGGAVMIEPYLKKWYGEKMLDRTKHSTTKKLHPVDMNAVGGLRLAMMRLKSNKTK